MSNTIQLTGVSRTMVATLKTRAEEQERPDCLFQDPLAVEWSKQLLLDYEIEEFSNRMGGLFQTSWSTRAYIHDQIISRHIANHSDPVVVELGAGLSTRFHRVGQNVKCWLDLDLPDVTNLRRQLDPETEQHQFIGASIMDFDWMNSIPDVGSENILFLAEGLLMYIKPSQVEELVKQMRSHFPGATWVMDVMGNFFKFFIKTTAKMDVELRWFVKNEQDLAAMGLQVINTWSLYQQYPKRWPWQLQPFLKFLTAFPYFRNAYLIVETEL